MSRLSATEENRINKYYTDSYLKITDASDKKRKEINDKYYATLKKVQDKHTEDINKINEELEKKIEFFKEQRKMMFEAALKKQEARIAVQERRTQRARDLEVFMQSCEEQRRANNGEM